MTGRTTRVRAGAGFAVLGRTGRTTRVRARAAGGTATAQSVQPFDAVNLGAGTWVQTGGTTVTPPTYAAPALRGGDVQTFTSAGVTQTVTVAPHTMFRITAGGLTGYVEKNL